MVKNDKKENTDKKVKLIPLGGLEQIGMNMTAIEYDAARTTFRKGNPRRKFSNCASTCPSVRPRASICRKSFSVNIGSFVFLGCRIVGPGAARRGRRAPRGTGKNRRKRNGPPRSFKVTK